MILSEFTQSINEAETPDPSLSLTLQSLWWDAKGDWNKAHDLCQQAASADGDWIHAYLHRKEGDTGNASYWYRRAGKPTCKQESEAEWTELVKTLISQNT